VAVLGLLILGDPVSTGTSVAIAVSLIGVLALSVAQTKLTFHNLITSLYGKTTRLGLACGAALGTSAVLYRRATLSLGGSFIIQAAMSLAVSLSIQMVLMGLYLAVREPGQLRLVLVHCRPALMVGMAAALASIFWRSACTLQNATYVRALGQIELVFATPISIIVFREKIKTMELAGIMFIVSGILILLGTKND